jgi:hypothetical protein
MARPKFEAKLSTFRSCGSTGAVALNVDVAYLAPARTGERMLGQVPGNSKRAQCVARRRPRTPAPSLTAATGSEQPVPAISARSRDLN